MKYIKYFENFSKRIMCAFDMDDTLLNSPNLTDFCINGNLPDKKTEMGKIIFNQLRANKIDPNDVFIDYEAGELKVPISLVKNKTWYRDGEWALVKRSDRFYKSPVSLGDIPFPKMKKIYLSSDYNCIITGRKESLRPIVESNLESLGLLPKNGLYMCPDNISKSEDIAKWKSDILNKLCLEYDLVNFYDDKSKWINIISHNMLDSDNINLYLVKNDKIKSSIIKKTI
jgi:hypothetical protein